MNTPDSSPRSFSPKALGAMPTLSAAVLLLALTIAVFADVLFSSKAVVLSKAHTDLFRQFAYWRDFGFGQLRQRNLPLWNPHIFSGMPFLGGFQSALFYPLNAVFLILPLARAVNVSIALHVFLLGLFMYGWAAHRGLHPMAALVSAVALMFSGAYFMHIEAGHLPHLCTMTWAPLIFLSLDGLFEKPSFRWALVGVGAVTMQILAGYPQHLFYTAVAAGLYVGLRIIKTQHRASILIAFFGVYLGALCLGAVQLLPGIDVAQQSVRSGGVSLEFAGSFSFPPENLATLLNPNLFGDGKNIAYWGRYHRWEMTLYMGLASFVLALIGAFRGEKSLRRYSTTMAGLLLILALGRHTPLFKLVFRWVPGFDVFRGNSKFIFQASLFIAMLAGIGLHEILNMDSIGKKGLLAVSSGAVLIGAAGLFVHFSVSASVPGHVWQRIMHAVYNTGESYLSESRILDPEFVCNAGTSAADALMFSSAVLLLMTGLLAAVRRSTGLISAIVLLAIIEPFVIARSSLAHFDLQALQVPQIDRVLKQNPGDYRILNLKAPDSAMVLDRYDIWGYDSMVLKRYAEFMTFTQGGNPDKASQYVSFSRFHHLYRMLRCRFGFIPSKARIGIIDNDSALPRLLLVGQYTVVPDRDEIFRYMEDPAFDPGKEVILETPPSVHPVPSGEKGRVAVMESATDYFVVKADLSETAILVITDAYCRGWRAQSLAKSGQDHYEIMPANYILRAVPLRKGRHLIRFEYRPVSFTAGLWISATAFFLVIILIASRIRLGLNKREAR
ncbi:MAG: YfhO family protein [Deltaproteobacteria bacterium]|nr:YfhO family protein [Deltaproteobacteria bacterium]